MFTRLFNRTGAAYRPGHLNPKDWKYFDFSYSWANIHKAYDLRDFHNQIAPSFNKFAVQRAIEQEDLHHDFNAFQARKTIYFFIAWIFATNFLVDWESMDRPVRHPLVEDRVNGPITRTRMTFMQDDS